MAVTIDAPAKLNLLLEVLRRRDDGYHEIDTVMQTVSLCDRITLEGADELTLEVEGDAPADSSNLAWQAAEALGAAVRIRLEKRIPSGAGLGGGSSDAAAVLLGVNRLLGLGRSHGELHAIATRLGADVPFFLTGGLARCRGIGERVEPVPDAPPARFLLAAPDRTSATAAVYAQLPPGLTGNPELARVFLKEYCLGEGPGRACYRNRLQEAAERLDPSLRRFRQGAEEVFGTAFTLTGSGAAYFAATVEDPALGSRATLGGVPGRVWALEARGPGRLEGG